jgi:subtilisin family serine protease
MQAADNILFPLTRDRQGGRALSLLAPHIRVYEVDEGLEDLSVAALRSLPRVKACRDVLGTLTSLPTDPGFTSGDQWWARNTGQTIASQPGIPGADICMWRVWEAGFTDSTSAPVAIFDTGVNYVHTELAQSILVNGPEYFGAPDHDDDANGVADDVYGAAFVEGTPYTFCDWFFDTDPSDWGKGEPFDKIWEYEFVNARWLPSLQTLQSRPGWHGTACAAIIGSQHNNFTPPASNIAGVASNASIIPVRLVHACRVEDANLWAVSDLLAGMYYAADRGAKVMSMSITVESDVAGLELATAVFEDVANTWNILFVVSASNYDENWDVPSSPSEPTLNRVPQRIGIPEVVMVGMSDNRDQRVTGSGYGANTVDVFAPGWKIRVFHNNQVSPDGFVTGTSFSTPMVAGLAAMYRHHHPNAPAVKVASELRKSCRPVPGFDQWCQCAGIVDASRLMLSAPCQP